MKEIIILLLFTTYGINIGNSQTATPQGKWRGSCSINSSAQTTLSAQVRKINPTTYQGYGLEIRGKITTTFEFIIKYDQRLHIGTIPLKDFSNIVVKRGDQILYKFNDATELDDFQDLNRVQYSSCICDDDKDVKITFDDKYNYFDTVCDDGVAFWNLGQNRKSPPTGLDKVKKINPNINTDSVKLLSHCSDKRPDLLPIDTIIINRELPAEIIIRDRHNDDGDRLNVYHDEIMVIEGVTIDGDGVTLPNIVRNRVNLAVCTSSTGSEGLCSGELLVRQDNIVIFQSKLTMSHGDARKFLILRK